MLRTGNPILNERSFESVAGTSEVMTLEGTVNKTVISVILTMVAAYWAFFDSTLWRLSWVAVIIGLILSLIISFKRTSAPLLTPVYAVVEGVFLGAFSRFAEMNYPGIAMQAISLTFGVLLSLLFVYKSGWIKVTENFKLGLAAATGGICILYLISFVLSLFGLPLSFLYSASPISIGISLAVCVIAALNLVLDFDFIENAARSRQVPKYMEWYGAFGLLVTLIWLYIEIVRLLMKLNSSRDR